MSGSKTTGDNHTVVRGAQALQLAYHALRIVSHHRMSTHLGTKLGALFGYPRRIGIYHLTNAEFIAYGKYCNGIHSLPPVICFVVIVARHLMYAGL
jgi:hypothetical protein